MADSAFASKPHSDRSPHNEGRLAFMLRAFRSRNYRLYFGGQALSLIGTWMSRIAVSWLVYRLTNSAFLLGVVGFVGQIPTLLVAPLAGALVDRWSRHRVMVVTQALAMVQSFALSAMVFSGTASIWAITLLAAFQGVINAFDASARQALLPELIEDRATLPNAIALNSSMVTGARLVGPAIGGVIIGAGGEGVCFLVDGISYLAVIASLLLMKLPARPDTVARGQVISHIGEGFRYAFHFPPIRALIILMAIVSLMGMPYTVLMPVISKDILGGGPHTLGFLMASSAIGSLLAAMYLASRRTVLGLGKWIMSSAALFGVGLVLFSLSHRVWLSLLLLVPVGFGMMLQMAATNTILQTISDEDKRGRLMSIHSMAFFGTVPIGSLVAGVLADRIGTMLTVALGGVCCVVAAGYFAARLPELRAMVRPIYARLGILPEIAAGLGQTEYLAEAENQ